MKSIFAITAFLGTLYGAPAWGDPTGYIRVCRPAGVSSMYDHKDILVPVGTAFVDVGTGNPNIDTGDNYLPVTLRTSLQAVVKAGQRCVKAPATASIRAPGLVVAPGNYRLYGFSGSVVPGVSAGVSDLVAFPATAFR